MKLIKGIINGGSTLIYSIFVIIFFYGKMAFGFEGAALYEMIFWVNASYLFLQGLQSNLIKTANPLGAGIDFFISIIPLFLILGAVFLVSDTGDAWSYGCRVAIFVVLFDNIIFGWSNLRTLLHADRVSVGNT